MPQCDNTSFIKHLIYFSSNEQQQLDSILNLIVHYLPYLKISKSVLVLPADFSSFILYFFIFHLIISLKLSSRDSNTNTLFLWYPEHNSTTVTTSMPYFIHFCFKI